ncbi:hypothetical protein WMY93_004190 [Mugilogobius chulae]|uniref:Uncharacterized protein n=1 Tax=Mugilogobius chulae TaxID=88201 RepID=A0AAW0PNC0_9GOBI
MIVRSREDSKLVYPDFYLTGIKLKETKEYKYLGHYLSADLSDDRDIYRQCQQLYGQANMLVRKFGACSAAVKIKLFKAYCTPMYTAHLWRHYRRSSLHRLNVAYNDGLRMLLRVPRWSSASQMFVNSGVPTCPAVLRRLMYSCMQRLTVSMNSIIQTLTNPALSSVRYFSSTWTHWRVSLYRIT